MTTLQVLRTGPLSLVQDLGRVGHAGVGVGRSGAADRASLRSANRLVGNPDAAAAVECVLGGLSVEIDAAVLIALTGAPAPLTVDGNPVQHGVAIEVGAGQRVKLGTPKSGLRSYLAVRGGIDVGPVLGSRSTDTLSGIGPAALAAGDRLPVGPAPTAEPVAPQQLRLPAGGTLTLRTTLGPRDDWFVTPAQLTVGDWVVSPQSNRVGLRLHRVAGADPEQAPPLRRRHPGELPSEGVALGSIQVPPGGQPVLFLADHPVTGGYPVIAVVHEADVDLAAQARPGQRMRFVVVAAWSHLPAPPEVPAADPRSV